MPEACQISDSTLIVILNWLSLQISVKSKYFIFVVYVRRGVVQSCFKVWRVSQGCGSELGEDKERCSEFGSDSAPASEAGRVRKAPPRHGQERTVHAIINQSPRTAGNSIRLNTDRGCSAPCCAVQLLLVQLGLRSPTALNPLATSSTENRQQT